MQKVIICLWGLLYGLCIQTLTAQNFQPSLALTASRFSGSTNGARMHHPGLELALAIGNKKIHPIFRIQAGRISGENTWNPYDPPLNSGFLTDYQTLGGGVNYRPLPQTKICPQFRVLLQVLNYLPKDFNGNTRLSDRSLVRSFATGLGLKWQSDPDFSFFIFWEYHAIAGDLTGGRNFPGRNGFSQLGIGMMGGKGK
jgi:hypothetical protein